MPIMAETAASGTGPPGPFSRRRAASHGEVRLPASVSVVVAGVLHTLLPSALLLEPRWLIPTFEALLLVALSIINPTRMTTETRLSRWLSVLLAALIIVTNMISLGYVLQQLTAAHPSNGRDLLLAAVQVWITNMIAFALVFWELDRGGAVARLPSSDITMQRADFLFPQDDPRVAQLELGRADEHWLPMFIDYLYLSITNSVAFSPTDTMPLTGRAKTLMAVESIAALVTSVLVIARGVNILA